MIWGKLSRQSEYVCYTNKIRRSNNDAALVSVCGEESGGGNGCRFLFSFVIAINQAFKELQTEIWAGLKWTLYYVRINVISYVWSELFPKRNTRIGEVRVHAIRLGPFAL